MTDTRTPSIPRIEQLSTTSISIRSGPWDAIRPRIHAAAEDCLGRNAGKTAATATGQARAK
jgi:hypothetical protein